MVRDSIFPNHTIKFTGGLKQGLKTARSKIDVDLAGTTIWRTLIPITTVKDIGPEVYSGTSWWFGTAGHVYFSPVDDKNELAEEERQFEISCRNLVDPATDTTKRFSWGVPATNERVVSHFTVSARDTGYVLDLC